MEKPDFNFHAEELQSSPYANKLVTCLHGIYNLSLTFIFSVLVNNI